MASIVAVATQFSPKRGALERNIGVMHHIALDMSLQGAQIIVFPELATCGGSMLSVRDAALHAQPVDGWMTERMLRAADDTGAVIIFGYVESRNGSFYNSALLVGPQGIIGNFSKRNLWGEDHFWAVPGDTPDNLTVNTHVGRVGVLISRDCENSLRRDPNSRQFYTKGSVDVVCVPVSWDTTQEFPDSSWTDLSAKLGCSVLISNRPSYEGENFIGGSCIIDSSGGVWTAGAERNGEGAVGAMIADRRR
jgi:predicted amidohydrolase